MEDHFELTTFYKYREEKKKMKIGIHAGHTTTAPGTGAVGYKTEHIENRKVLEYLKKYLSVYKGVTVIDTTNDKAKSVWHNLNAICQKSNKNRVDLELSLHMNSSTDLTANGCECYVHPSTTVENRRLARKICASLAKTCKLKNRGVKSSSGLFVLKNTKAPAILIECYFVSNYSDCKKATPQKVAIAICNALKEVMELV